MALYKFLRTGLKSEHGDVAWKIGEWQHIEGELVICRNGFHCSRTPYDAFEYVQGSILAEVEIDTDFIEEEDKICAKSMKIVKAWYWRKEDSAALAIFAAQSVLNIYENKYPKDNRPRRAIEAAQAWLDAAAGADADVAAAAAAYTAGAAADAAAAGDAAGADAAAYAAGDAAGAGDAAYAAYAAGAYAAYAAGNATYAASNAAYAAGAAAYAAGAYATSVAGAYAAYAAGDAAGNAAYAAGDAYIKKILNDWMINRIPKLEEL